MENFELVHTIQAYEKIPVTEYRSKKTGLTVFIVKIDRPINNALLALANETFDDDAIPTILQRLICMGSEKYPYKYFLKTLASRCLSFTSDAYTVIDHTYFSIESIHNEGLLTMLPVLVENILYPALSEAGYHTEIHHISEEGEDAGVLYREIEEFENVDYTLLDLTVMKHIYPGKCGYSSAYRGKTKNLRESVNIDKVRQYHKQFYKPENLKIIISGTVEHKAVFRSLENIEEKIISQGQRHTFQRLWQTSIPPMIEDAKDVTIIYPSEEETTGLACMAWRGPSSVIEIYNLLAVSIFLKYLAYSDFSPMTKEFVDIDEPYAGNVHYYLQEGVESCIVIYFEEVPLNKLCEITPKVQGFLKKMLYDKNINMEDLRNVLNKYKLENLNDLERTPHDHLSIKIIHHMLYGNAKDDFQQRLNPLHDMEKLLEEPQTFWLDLLQKYFVENKYVSVQCLPSKEENLRQKSMEKERIAVQRQKLTVDELKEKEVILKNAIDYNERKFPPDLFNSFPIPSLDSIKFLNICRYSSENSDKGRIDLSETPVFTYFDHVKSNFVYMYAILDTYNIPKELVNYLHLLKDIILELPIQQEECLVHHEDVMKKLENGTIFTNAVLHNFGYKFVLQLQVEESKYENGVGWLRDLLYNTRITVERLRVAAKRMMDTLQRKKQHEGNMVDDILDEMCYPLFGPENRVKNITLRKIKFLSEVIKKLETDNGGYEILKNINKLKETITKPSNVVLYFAGNLDCLKNPVKSINEFLPPHLQHVKMQRRLTPIHGCTFLDFSNPLNGSILGHTPLRVSVFSQRTKSLTSFNDPDYPALYLYLKYLSKLKNNAWETYIRKGLTFSIQINSNEGILSLYFSLKDDDIITAYIALKEMIVNQIERKEWDTTLLDSERGSCIFENVYEEETYSEVICRSVSSYIYDYDFDCYRNIVKLFGKVTIEDLNRVGEKHILPLFDPPKSKTAVIVDPSKTTEIAKKFEQLGYNMEVYSSIETFMIYNVD